jgi:hypothetical protein
MTSAKTRMTKQFRMTNDESARSHALRGNSEPLRTMSRTMCNGLCWSTMSSVVRRSDFVIRHVMCVLVLWLLAGTPANAQEKVHMHHAGKLPPGMIGAQQVARGGPLAGYFQPVQIKAPAGVMVSLAINGQFSAPQRTPLTVGMFVAPVYRLRVTQIPNHIGEEVYPTVEVINRIYPPVGEEFRFPIPIELTQTELELALAGKFVTRVVYLEDPQQALPIVSSPQSEQSYFEVRPTDDPLEVADRLGRPVAILRIGGRLPDSAGPDEKFLYGSPPVLIPNSLDLCSEPVAEISSTENAIASSTEKTPRSSVLKALAPTGKDEKEKVVLATAEVEADKSSAPSATSNAEPAGVQAGQRHSSRRNPVVKAAVPKRIQDPAWQSNKPAPVSVSISDDE